MTKLLRNWASAVSPLNGGTQLATLICMVLCCCPDPPDAAEPLSVRCALACPTAFTLIFTLAPLARATLSLLAHRLAEPSG